MKSGLQKAALAKLAKLTQHDQLPSEVQGQLRERLLKRCAEPKKLLSNGINGVNGFGGSTRIMVFSSFSKIRKFGLISGLGQDRVQFVVGFNGYAHR